MKGIAVIMMMLTLIIGVASHHTGDCVKCRSDIMPTAIENLFYACLSRQIKITLRVVRTRIRFFNLLVQYEKNIGPRVKLMLLITISSMTISFALSRGRCKLNCNEHSMKTPQQRPTIVGNCAEEQ